MRDLFQVHEDRHWSLDILIYTRYWIHYGALAFVFFLALTAAAQGVFTR